MEKKCIIVQYSGKLDKALDRGIERTAKKGRLEWDGTGYDLTKHVREHFIYSSNPTRIANFKTAIKAFSSFSSIPIKVKVHKAA